MSHIKLPTSNKKEIVQHRNNLLPYYPKEYALPRINSIIFLSQDLKIIQNEPHLKKHRTK